MALTPETGAGLPNADSYNSLTELGEYHARNPRWSTDDSGNPVDEADQEDAARRATRFIDATAERHFTGMRAVVLQALAFPRYYGYYADGRVIASLTVPPELKWAHAELTMAALLGQLGTTLDRGGLEKRIKVDTIEIEYADGAPGGKCFEMAEAFLATLRMPVGQLQRGY